MMALTACRKPQIESSAKVKWLLAEDKVEKSLHEEWLLLPVMTFDGKIFSESLFVELTTEQRPQQNIKIWDQPKARRFPAFERNFQAFKDSIVQNHKIPASLVPLISGSWNSRLLLCCLINHQELIRPGPNQISRKLSLQVEAWDQVLGKKIFMAQAASISSAAKMENLASSSQLVQAALWKILRELPYNPLSAVKTSSGADF